MTEGELPETVSGLYRWIIGSLLFVISTLTGANVWQYRDASHVNKARLTERDVLNKTLSDVNATLATMAAASERRNEVMEKFGALITQLSVTLKMLSDRLELQNEHTTKDLEKALEVTETLADAVRTVAADTRQGFAEIKAHLKVTT